MTHSVVKSKVYDFFDKRESDSYKCQVPKVDQDHLTATASNSSAEWRYQTAGSQGPKQRTCRDT